MSTNIYTLKTGGQTQTHAFAKRLHQKNFSIYARERERLDFVFPVLLGCLQASCIFFTFRTDHTEGPVAHRQKADFSWCEEANNCQVGKQELFH